MHRAKSIIANFLLILFLGMQGSSILNQVCIVQHKKFEINAERENIYLSLSTEQWRKVEKENEAEIKVNGKMFDIKSIRIHEHKVILYGHYDTKEDNLIAKAEDDHKKGEQKKESNPHYTLFFQEEVFTSHQMRRVFQKQHYPLLQQMYFFQFHKIENPPPQFIA